MTEQEKKALDDVKAHVTSFRQTAKTLRQWVDHGAVDSSNTKYQQAIDELFTTNDDNTAIVELQPNEALEDLLTNLTKLSYSIIAEGIDFQLKLELTDTKISTSQDMRTQVRRVLLQESGMALKKLDQITNIAAGYHHKRLEIGVHGVKYKGLQRTAAKAIQFYDAVFVDELKLKIISAESILNSLIAMWDHNENVLVAESTRY